MAGSEVLNAEMKSNMKTSNNNNNIAMMIVRKNNSDTTCMLTKSQQYGVAYTQSDCI